MPVIRTAAELAAHAGEQVEVHGTYRVLSTGRHRIIYTRPDGSTGASDQVVQLELDGGTVALWVRPDDERAALANKAVVAVGRLVLPRGRGDRVMAEADAGPSLVDIASIAAE